MLNEGMAPSHDVLPGPPPVGHIGPLCARGNDYSSDDSVYQAEAIEMPVDELDAWYADEQPEVTVSHVGCTGNGEGLDGAELASDSGLVADRMASRADSLPGVEVGNDADSLSFVSRLDATDCDMAFGALDASQGVQVQVSYANGSSAEILDCQAAVRAMSASVDVPSDPGVGCLSTNVRSNHYTVLTRATHKCNRLLWMFGLHEHDLHLLIAQYAFVNT